MWCEETLYFWLAGGALIFRPSIINCFHCSKICVDQENTWYKKFLNLFLFLIYSGSEKFAIKNTPVVNNGSPDNPEEPKDMPNHVEAEYPVENSEDSDSDDYIEKLLKEIQNQSDDHNEEPSEEITPIDNSEWQGNIYFIYFYLDFFKCNWLDPVLPEDEKLWGGGSGNGGHNLPTPGLNRVNWFAKYWVGHWPLWPPSSGTTEIYVLQELLHLPFVNFNFIKELI